MDRLSGTDITLVTPGGRYELFAWGMSGIDCQISLLMADRIGELRFF